MLLLKNRKYNSYQGVSGVCPGHTSTGPGLREDLLQELEDFLPADTTTTRLAAARIAALNGVRARAIIVYSRASTLAAASSFSKRGYPTKKERSSTQGGKKAADSFFILFHIRSFFSPTLS